MIFHFRQISKLKKGVTLSVRNGIKISCGYTHLHGMFFTTTKFREILLSGFGGVGPTNCFSSIFHFGQISKFKKGRNSVKKKWNQNFLWICASTHYVHHNYKVSRNSIEQFQRSWADNK